MREPGHRRRSLQPCAQRPSVAAQQPSPGTRRLGHSSGSARGDLADSSSAPLPHHPRRSTIAQPQAHHCSRSTREHTHGHEPNDQRHKGVQIHSRFSATLESQSICVSGKSRVSLQPWMAISCDDAARHSAWIAVPTRELTRPGGITT